jgi:hypothetical protein
MVRWCKLLMVTGMASQLHENKLFHKYEEFMVDCDTLQKPWEPANAIDSMLGQAFETAERHCSTPDRPPWSEKLHLASMEVRYWQVALTERLTGVSQRTILAEIGPKIWKTVPPTPQLLRSLRSIGNAAKQALRRIRRDAYEERKAFLEELKARVVLRLSPNDTDADVALQSINRQLADTKIFARIRRSVKPVSQPALTKVEIVHTTSHLDPVTGASIVTKTVQIVDTRAELEAAIIARSK